MNSFSEIWSNPKERLDFIIAIFVCILFGMGIFYLYPTDAEYLADKSEQGATHSSQAKATRLNLQSAKAEGADMRYSKKILSDKDVEGKSAGFFQQKAQSTVDVEQSTTKGDDLDEGKIKGETETSESEESKANTNGNGQKIAKDLAEEKALNNLKTTDFQELEEEETVVDSNSANRLDKVGDTNAQELEEEPSNEDSSKADLVIGGEQEERIAEGKSEESERELEESAANTKSPEASKSETLITSNETTKTSNKKTTKEDSTTGQSGDCIIVVGAFEKAHNAQKIIRQLKRKNYTVKTGWRKGLKYVGVPVNCRDKKTVENTLQQLRNAFDIEAWLLKP